MGPKEPRTSILLCYCTSETISGRASCCLILPWTAGSSAGWPCVSWGWVSSGGHENLCRRRFPWASLHSLWLLSPPIGHAEPTVSQTPSYQVTEMGQRVILRCDPISGHIFLYWYRQNHRQEMEFLLSFQYRNIAAESAMPKERFSAERPNGTYSTLKIRPAEPGDSAVYLCASGSDAAPLSPFPPVCKPSAFSPLLHSRRTFEKAPSSPSCFGRKKWVDCCGSAAARKEQDHELSLKLS